MSVSSVTLQFFRCHQSWHVDLHPQLTLVVGQNAAGKTSLLEAIYLAATGRSVRAGKLAEVVKFGEELARVAVVLDDGNAGENVNLGEDGVSGSNKNQTKLEAMATIGHVQGQRTQALIVSVNGIRRTRKALVGKLPVSLFRPEDMRLIEGSPSRRREFLDLILSQVDVTYANSLKIYDQALRRYNKLLYAVRENTTPKSTLFYYQQQLLQTGEYLQTQRSHLISYLSQVKFSVPMRVDYTPSVISASRQKEHLEREIAAGHMLIGPQKDDFAVKMLEWPRELGAKRAHDDEELDIMIYGSRGQQRLAVVWLKAGEVEFLQDKFQQPPLMLLDDIHSELDETSWNWINDLMATRQSIVTSTHQDLINKLTSEKLVINI